MKALIAGATGFVGPYLIKAVINNLFCDVVATGIEGEDLSSLQVPSRVMNILDSKSIESVLKQERPEYIFYLVAQSSVAYSWKNPVQTVDVNIKGALNLLNAIRSLDYSPKILIVGSGEEYGYVKAEDVPIREDTSLTPGNIYAVTKACQNQMATIYANAYHMHLIMVRSFNHIGPGQSSQFVVSDFCRQVAEIESGISSNPIKVGNLSARRDFTDVRDVVNAYTKLIQFGKAGETYNVGSGKAISIDDILHMIIKYSRVDIQIQQDAARLRPADIPIIEADINKIYDACGWKPSIPLEVTIKDTLEFWRNRIKGEMG